MTEPDAPAQRGDIPFISLLRACAALFVVYDHLVGSWLEQHKLSWPPAELLTAFVVRPFAIIQNLGFLGVVLFFLISGFIITHVAMRETRREFAIKRVLRIYPPLIASLGVIALVNVIQHGPQPSLWAYALSATLLNYVVVPQVVVSGVAWSLAIEVTFYALAFVSLPWLQKRPVIASAGITTFALLVMLTSRSFGASYFLFAASMTYVPYLLAGQALYFAWARRITPAQCAALSAYAFVAIIVGIHLVQTTFLSASNSYGVSFLYAYLTFLACLLAARSIKTPPVMQFFARTSYSLYLLHGSIGFLILGALVPVAGYTVAILVALPTLIVVSALSFRFIELPSQMLARRLLHRAPEPSASTRSQPAPLASS